VACVLKTSGADLGPTPWRMESGILLHQMYTSMRKLETTAKGGCGIRVTPIFSKSMAKIGKTAVGLQQMSAHTSSY